LAIDRDRVVGPARVTRGNVSDIQIDEKNVMFILTENGIYSEIQIKEEGEMKEIKLAGSTVDLGAILDMGLKKLAINPDKSDGPKLLYNKSQIVVFNLDDLI
jgi:hypothetical protein